jgi:hypothetical protein
MYRWVFNIFVTNARLMYTWAFSFFSNYFVLCLVIGLTMLVAFCLGTEEVSTLGCPRHRDREWLTHNTARTTTGCRLYGTPHMCSFASASEDLLVENDLLEWCFRGAILRMIRLAFCGGKLVVQLPQTGGLRLIVILLSCVLSVGFNLFTQI